MAIIIIVYIRISKWTIENDDFSFVERYPGDPGEAGANPLIFLSTVN